MLKYVFFLFSVLVSTSMVAKTGKVLVTGTVKNHSATSISITTINNREVVTTQLDDRGTFTLTTSIEEGYYFLAYGRTTAPIFLYPKDNLTVYVDANNFETTLNFKGQGAERNNYLVQKSIVEKEMTKDLASFYKPEEQEYLKNITTLQNTHQELLQQYDVESFFKKAEVKSLAYQRLFNINNYESNYSFYLGEEISPSEEFYKPIRDLKLDNVADYNKFRFYQYIVDSVWNERIEEAPNVDAMLAVIREVTFEELAISLVNGFYSKISSKNSERAKDYLDLIKRVTTYQPFIDAAEERYNEITNSKQLTKGSISPLFAYENTNGDLVKLSDFKGNYVYIDVWATWCAPCIKQIPYIKKLEKRYHDKNIVFVSISVDKKEIKDTWKQFIHDKELDGIQLFADNSFESDFMNAYAVNSIPRFILIDPEGKIIDPEAPRPSFEKTKTILDGLLE